MCIECNSFTHVQLYLLQPRMHNERHFLFLLSFPKTPYTALILLQKYFVPFYIALNKVQEMMRMYLTNRRHLTFRNPDSFYFRCNGKWHQISKILWKWISFQPCSVFGPLLGKLIVDGSWYDCRFFNVSFFIIRGNKEHCWGVI